MKETLQSEIRRNREFLRETNPGVRAMVRSFRNLTEAKKQIAEAAKWLQYRHNERREPNNSEQHRQVDELLEKMLEDYAQLIGRSYIRRITKAECNE